MTAGCPDISSVGSWTSLPTSLFASIGDRLSTAPLYSLFFWLLSVCLSTVCRIVNRHTDNNQKNKDRKSTRLNSSHVSISYAVFCLIKKRTPQLRAAAP